MDSIETEEYERMMKEEDERIKLNYLVMLNDLALSINEELFVEIDSSYTVCLYLNDNDNKVLQYKDEVCGVKGFLKGYHFAKSSLPF